MIPGVDSGASPETAGALVSSADDPLTRTARLVIIAIVVGVLLSGIALRIPLLNRPASEKRHADGTARVLRHMGIWDEVGLSSTHWMMRTTGAKPADRFIQDIGYLTDSSSGILYYASFPPLYPLAPYAVFKLLRVQETILSVRVFNILLQILGTLALFLLALRATRAFGERFAWTAAGFAAVLYASAPLLLWYHSNAYTTSSLSTPFFLFAVYLAVRAIHDDQMAWWILPALAAATFAVAFTEWLGVILAMTAVAYALVRWRHRPSRVMALVVMASAGAATLTMLVQYSSIAGVGAFIAAISGKYAMRSGYTETSHASITAPDRWLALSRGYGKSYQPFVFVTMVLAAVPLWRALKARRSSVAAGTWGAEVRAWFKTPLATALIFCAAPVLLHIFLFFSHNSIHDFDAMKAAGLLGILFGLSAAAFDRMLRSDGHPYRGLVALVLIVIVIVPHTYRLSYRQNFTSRSGAQVVGETIRATGVADDEVVFIGGGKFYAGSTAAYYAGRNIAVYVDAPGAAALMTKSGAKGGVFFEVSEDGKRVSSIMTVRADGVITERVK